MSRVFILALLGACTGSPTSDPPAPRPAGPGTEPVTPSPLRDQPPAPEAPTPEGPPFTPATVQLRATFGADSATDTLHPFTLQGQVVPVALDLFVSEAGPAPTTCGLRLSPLAAHPAVTRAPGAPAGHAGLTLTPGEFAIVDRDEPALGVVGCRALSRQRPFTEAPWGADPMAAVGSSTWGVYVGPLPADVAARLDPSHPYARGEATGALLVTTTLGEALLPTGSARRLDADFAVVMNGDRAVPLSPAEVHAEDGLLATGAYLITSDEVVLPADALIAVE